MLSVAVSNQLKGVLFPGRLSSSIRARATSSIHANANSAKIKFSTRVMKVARLSGGMSTCHCESSGHGETHKTCAVCFTPAASFLGLLFLMQVMGITHHVQNIYQKLLISGYNSLDSPADVTLVASNMTTLTAVGRPPRLKSHQFLHQVMHPNTHPSSTRVIYCPLNMARPLPKSVACDFVVYGADAERHAGEQRQARDQLGRTAPTLLILVRGFIE